MDAVVAMTGHGGWPMTVFLTPDGEPFYGGTYFPPEPRHGLPGFRQVLERGRRGLPRAARRRRARGRRSSSRRVRRSARAAALGRAAHGVAARPGAARGSRARFDPDWGGFGGAPKFPPASALEFLLRRGERRERRDGRRHARRHGRGRDVRPRRRRLPPLLGRRALARAALREDALRQRAARPRVPARLARDRRGALPRASPRRRSTTCCASCALPEGGFASSQDADTDGVEGLTYTWTPRSEGVAASRAARAVRARALRSSAASSSRRRARAAARACARSGRSRGATTRRSPSWNGLALAALAEAGRRLERDDWLDAARAGSASSCSGRSPTATAVCYRSLARRARRAAPGFLDDYADVAHGLYELHVATGELRWLEEARRLALLAVELFADDERGGFFLAPARRRAARRAQEGPRRPPDAVGQLDARLRAAAARRGSTATTSSSGARSACFRLVARRRSTRAPSAFGWALCALDLYLSPPRELAIVGPPASEVARAALAPFAARTRSSRSARREDVPLLAGKTLVDGKPAVYVCERFACQAPVTDPSALR